MSGGTDSETRMPRGAASPARTWLFAGLAILTSLAAASQVYAGDATAGRKKAVQCQACHGLDGLSKLPEAPHIAGQPEAYLVKSMNAYRQGERKDEMMTLVVQQLSPQDIDDLAAYYAAIEFSVKVPQ